MRITFDLRETFKRFSLLLFFLLILIIQTDSQKLTALTMENYQSGIVIEELRIKVPFEFKEVWLQAEKKIWDPWLSSKAGFLGRQLLWDKQKKKL